MKPKRDAYQIWELLNPVLSIWRVLIDIDSITILYPIEEYILKMDSSKVSVKIVTWWLGCISRRLSIVAFSLYVKLSTEVVHTRKKPFVRASLCNLFRIVCVSINVSSLLISLVDEEANSQTFANLGTRRSSNMMLILPHMKRVIRKAVNSLFFMIFSSRNNVLVSIYQLWSEYKPI